MPQCFWYVFEKQSWRLFFSAKTYILEIYGSPPALEAEGTALLDAIIWIRHMNLQQPHC